VEGAAMTDYEAAFRTLTDKWHESVKHYEERIEKLEAALRFIAGPSTVEFVDGTYEISETKMLSTYRRRAKRALEGNYDD
jgi:hypothetical protein